MCWLKKLNAFTGGNKNVYGFVSFKLFDKLIKELYNKDMTIDKAEAKQNEFAKNLNELRAYAAKGSKYIDLKKSF